ncbi:MAG: YigZ family protein [Clostridiaceae bacterium]|nr:YigZ family protein [Clostridiaceae bacterium]
MADSTYLVPFTASEIEMIEKKSRFIGNVFLVENEEEALARIAEIAHRHQSATHGVYAYDIHAQNITRFSDAGEPKGTAGMPVLDVFRKRKITNFVCIVTRYFGGILLGAGGLVRAYSQTAALALDAAGEAKMAPYCRLEILIEYPYFEKLKYLLSDYPIRESDTTYDLDVTHTILIPEALKCPIADAVAECTAGRAIITEGETRFLPERVFSD